MPTAQTRILASVPATMPQPGDTLRIEVRGTSPVLIRGLHKGVEVISATDSAHQRITASGVVGMVSRLRRGGYTAPPNSPIFASWRGGSLGTELRIQPGNGNGADFVLQFNTSSNKTYTVEGSETLNSPNWTAVSTMNGDGGEKSVAITNSASQRFYRVRMN